MNGKTLKERIAQLSNMTYTDIAKRLNVSEQSMYQYFLVNDVKSGLIERICEIIGVDIPTMYGIEPAPTISHNAGDVITGNNIANRVDDMGAQMITILDNQLRVKDEQIDKLLNILNK